MYVKYQKSDIWCGESTKFVRSGSGAETRGTRQMISLETCTRHAYRARRVKGD